MARAARRGVSAGTGPELHVATLPNLRDAGGLPTRDGGRVRTGLLFRSTDLARLDAAGVATLEALGIRAVFDLRTARERGAAPDRLPPGARAIVVDVLRDSRGMTPADMEAVFADPRSAAGALGGGRAERFFVDAYREFVELASAREAYRRLYLELGRPDGRPGLVHCTTGKDRTGWAVAALLLLLGVPDSLVEQEYLRSGPPIAALFAPYLAEFAARGGDPELIRPLADVRPAYLASAMAAVRERHGSIEGYFGEGLGLAATDVEALRDAFVER